MVPGAVVEESVAQGTTTLFARWDPPSRRRCRRRWCCRCWCRRCPRSRPVRRAVMAVSTSMTWARRRGPGLRLVLTGPRPLSPAAVQRGVGRVSHPRDGVAEHGEVVASVGGSTWSSSIARAQPSRGDDRVRLLRRDWSRISSASSSACAVTSSGGGSPRAPWPRGGAGFLLGLPHPGDDVGGDLVDAAADVDDGGCPPVCSRPGTVATGGAKVGGSSRCRRCGLARGPAR